MTRSRCLWICLIFGCMQYRAAAQNNEPGLHFQKAGVVAADKEKAWMDSLKQVIKKYEAEQNELKARKKYFAFVNSSVALGMFYEKKFDAGELADMKKAVFYYKKVADFSIMPDKPEYFHGADIKTTLYRKSADIYFKGKGVKKDISYSRQLALSGIGNIRELFSFYSRRYYSCNCIIPDTIKMYLPGNEIINSYKVNPFAEKVYLFKISNKIEKLLAPLVQEYKLRRRRDNNAVLLTFYPEATAISQSLCNRILDNIKNYLVEKEKIPGKDIITNCEVVDGPEKHIVDIKFEAVQ